MSQAKYFLLGEKFSFNYSFLSSWFKYDSSAYKQAPSQRNISNRLFPFSFSMCIFQIKY